MLTAQRFSRAASAGTFAACPRTALTGRAAVSAAATRSPFLTLAAQSRTALPRRPVAVPQPRAASLAAAMSRSLSQRSGAAKETTAVSAVPATGAADPQTEAEGGSEADHSECASESDKRFWWFVSGVSGALAIAAGSFGAHGLKKSVSDVYYLDVWQTAAHYHLTHSIVLGLAPVVVAALRRQRARTGLSVGQQLRQTLGLRKGAGAGTAVLRGSAKASSVVRLRPYRNWAATLIASGGAIFCGSLYALVLTEQGRPWGMIAPVGGFAIIAGWLCLAIGL